MRACACAGALPQPRASAQPQAYYDGIKARFAEERDLRLGYRPEGPAQFTSDLPGALAPMGQWDPAGFTSQASDNDIRRYREAETQHGRVAMLAVIGFLVAESWHPLFADVTGPAIDHLTQVRQEYPAFFEIGALVIGGLEVNRALVGWAVPDSREKVRAPRPLSI